MPVGIANKPRKQYAYRHKFKLDGIRYVLREQRLWVRVPLSARMLVISTVAVTALCLHRQNRINLERQTNLVKPNQALGRLRFMWICVIPQRTPERHLTHHVAHTPGKAGALKDVFCDKYTVPVSCQEKDKILDTVTMPRDKTQIQHRQSDESHLCDKILCLELFKLVSFFELLYRIALSQLNLANSKKFRGEVVCETRSRQVVAKNPGKQTWSQRTCYARKFGYFRCCVTKNGITITRWQQGLSHVFRIHNVTWTDKKLNKWNHFFECVEKVQENATIPFFVWNWEYNSPDRGQWGAWNAWKRQSCRINIYCSTWTVMV